jgi:hypothetical protein
MHRIQEAANRALFLRVPDVVEETGKTISHLHLVAEPAILPFLRTRSEARAGSAFGIIALAAASGN